jgi:hypothetical protein
MARLRIGSHKLNERRTYFAMLIMVIIWSSLILTVGILNGLETHKKKTSLAADPSASVDRDGIVTLQQGLTFDGIAIFAQVSEINLVKWQYVVFFAIFPQAYSK